MTREIRRPREAAVAQSARQAARRPGAHGGTTSAATAKEHRAFSPSVPGSSPGRSLARSTIDCADPACECECHRQDVEHPAPHLPTCSWADPAFVSIDDMSTNDGRGAASCGVHRFADAEAADRGDTCPWCTISRLQARLAYAREKFEDIVEDAKVLREHARRAPDLDMMILGIQVVAENEARALAPTEPNGATKEGSDGE